MPTEVVSSRETLCEREGDSGGGGTHSQVPGARAVAGSPPAPHGALLETAVCSSENRRENGEPCAVIGRYSPAAPQTQDCCVPVGLRAGPVPPPVAPPPRDPRHPACVPAARTPGRAPEGVVVLPRALSGGGGAGGHGGPPPPRPFFPAPPSRSCRFSQGPLSLGPGGCVSGWSVVGRCRAPSGGFS